MRAMLEGVKSFQNGGGLGHVEALAFPSSAILAVRYIK